jgi:hypothetical protein
MTSSGDSNIGQQAQQARLAQRLRRPGFYVVNVRTGLAVAGPFAYEELAVREAVWQNGPYDDAPPSPFEVRVMVFGWHLGSFRGSSRRKADVVLCEPPLPESRRNPK